MEREGDTQTDFKKSFRYVADNNYIANKNAGYFVKNIIHMKINIDIGIYLCPKKCTVNDSWRTEISHDFIAQVS